MTEPNEKIEIKNFKLDEMDYANIQAYYASPVSKSIEKIMAQATSVWTAMLITEKDVETVRQLQGRIQAANYLVNVPKMEFLNYNERIKKKAAQDAAELKVSKDLAARRSVV